MIKYSCKYILWKHDKTSQGKYPIYLRITINRNSKYIASGISVIEKNWDKKNELVINNTLANLWNADLSARKQNIIRAITERQIENQEVTAGELKEQFSTNANLHNFFDFAEKFISEVGARRSPNTKLSYKKLLNTIQKFHGSKTLSFEQINHDFLTRFDAFLRKKSLSDNYIYALWKLLKIFFNAARKRKLITNYPFETYENPKYTSPEKDYLSLEEIGRIEKIADETKDDTIKQTAVWFLLGCFTGLRISDWYQFDIKKHVKGNEILLRAKKNKEWVTMPVHSRLKINLKRMAGTKLTITDVEVNRSLKDIAKEIETNKYLHSHVARHSFAVTMCLNRGISSEVAAELMAINLTTFIENYSQITKQKVFAEAMKAWKNL